MKSLIIVSLLMLTSIACADCRKEAEAAAITKDKRDNPDPKLMAKSTSQLTEGMKADEEGWYTEIHTSKGSFAPYEIHLKKKDCKFVSAKAVTL